LSSKTYGLINEVFLCGDDIDRRLFSHYGLTVRQYHLLHWLARREQASLTELAKLLLCDKSNVTGLARRLEAACLIEKVPSVDRRFTRVQLTAEGKRIHDATEQALNYSIACRFTGMPEADHAQLQALLQQVYERLHQYLQTPQDPDAETHDYVSHGKGVMSLGSH